MSNLNVVVSWVHRIDGSQIHSRHDVDGITDFRPPRPVIWGDRKEGETLECRPEIENPDEKEIIDYFLQAVDELEPLIDLTQL